MLSMTASGTSQVQSLEHTNEPLQPIGGFEETNPVGNPSQLPNPEYNADELTILHTSKPQRIPHKQQSLNKFYAKTSSGGWHPRPLNIQQNNQIDIRGQRLTTIPAQNGTESLLHQNMNLYNENEP